MKYVCSCCGKPLDKSSFFEDSWFHTKYEDWENCSATNDDYYGIPVEEVEKPPKISGPPLTRNIVIWMT